MKHERRDRLLDLGWYPESDLDRGHYGLVVYEGNFQGHLLHERIRRSWTVERWPARKLADDNGLKVGDVRLVPMDWDGKDESD